MTLKKWKVKAKELKVKVQPIPAFFKVTKVADFWWKNADICRTQKVCHVI